MIFATTERVLVNTPGHLNEEIRRQTHANIDYYASRPQEIEQRLHELDREWDVERLIETESSSMILLGVILGTAADRKWLLVSVFAALMLILHNVQGWYPLLPLLRRLGVRTQEEIAYERYELKALRGDFRRVDEGDGEARSHRAFEAAWH
jgi:hypothetical protein